MNQNKEVIKQPQWVVDILNRLYKLEDRVLYLERCLETTRYDE